MTAISFQIAPVLLTLRPPWQPFDLAIAQANFPIAYEVLFVFEGGVETRWMRASRWPLSAIPEEDVEDEPTNEEAST